MSIHSVVKSLPWKVEALTSGKTLLAESVLEDFAVLHDQRQVLASVADEGHILKRVAIDQQVSWSSSPWTLMR